MTKKGPLPESVLHTIMLRRVGLMISLLGRSQIAMARLLPYPVRSEAFSWLEGTHPQEKSWNSYDPYKALWQSVTLMHRKFLRLSKYARHPPLSQLAFSFMESAWIQQEQQGTMIIDMLSDGIS